MRALYLRLVLCAVGAASGCSSAPDVSVPECDGSAGCEPPPDSGAGLCLGDPAAGPLEDRCGVFVSSSIGSDDNPGTRVHPVRSLQVALTRAQAGAKRVYACAEDFAEAVELPAGVELWGGLDCANGWSYVGQERRTAIVPGADAIPLQITAGDGMAIVADVHVEAAGTSSPSGSAIAVIVMPSAAVEIQRSELVAGDGSPGINGADGGTTPAQSGTPGSSGGNACSADVVPGGPAVITVCGEVITIGGQGGQGNITFGSNGTNGQPEPSPNSMDWGQGGTGETSTVQCQGGNQGLSGASGEHGHGGRGPGRISIAGWEGENGQHGGDGLPGQGGGGAGGNRGGSLLCGFGVVKAGAGGGSGGGGACGGKGGKGGGYGGASIGLLSLSEQVTVRETRIITGSGGDGGAGGLAQLGGTGGPGGPGGAPFYGANGGCHGGPGGHGGHGGFGGGGLGGPSIGIAHPLGAPVAQEDVTIQTGLPGKGGLGGSTEIPEGAGEDGVGAEVLAFS